MTTNIFSSGCLSRRAKVSQRASSWRDAPVAAHTDTRIEDAILTRARQLRLETVKR